MLPAPPAGCGPTLGVHHGADIRDRAPIIAGVALAYAAVAWWEHAQGLEWNAALAIFGVLFVLTVAALLRGRVTVGEDWLQHRSALRSSWVCTSKLVELSVQSGYTGSTVHLADDEGRRVHVRLDDIARTATVWQPLQSSIRRSMARGRLAIDEATRKSLGFS